MANNVQKLIYNLSNTIPFIFIFSFVWYYENNDWKIPLILSCFACCIIGLFFVSFLYAKKRVEIIKINVIDIEPNDDWGSMYIVSNLFPLVSLVIKDINLWMTLGLSVLYVVYSFFANLNRPNVLLLLSKYHFYKISTENGITGYIFISKRDLRNINDIKICKRIFEFLILDVEEKI